MKNSRFKQADRVRPIKGTYASFLFIVDNYFFDVKRGEYVYMVHGEVSPTNVRYYGESEIEFA